MRLGDLSSDTLRLICEKLDSEGIAKLYATNERALMRRIVSRDISSTINLITMPSPLLVRLLKEHSSLRTFSSFNQLEDLEMPEHCESAYSHYPIPARLLLDLPRSLTALELSNKFELFAPAPLMTETFATLLPNLKSLSFRPPSNSDAQYTPCPAFLAQLMSELPANLEHLGLNTNFVVRLEALPSSLTSLAVTHGIPIATLANYPLQNPTYELIQRLHTATPNLRLLWTCLADAATHLQATAMPDPRFNSPTPIGQDAPTFLPQLTYLGLRGNSAFSVEVEAIIASLPSVTTLNLAIATGKYGFEVPDAPSLPSGLVRCTFPPNLTSLSLGPLRYYSRLEVGKQFFQTLPSSLASLSLRFCNMDWALQYGQGWEPMPPPPPVTRFGFGGRTTQDSFEDYEKALPQDFTKECWTSFLPRNLEHLQVKECSPIHVNSLPASLRTLYVLNGDDAHDYNIATHILPPKVPDFKSELRWPPLLQELTNYKHKFTLADALSLPPSLTQLRIVPSVGWNQSDAKELLDRLPKCTVSLRGAYLWVTDSADTSSTDTGDALTLATEDGHVDLDRFLFSRLSSLPPRISAIWLPSVPDTSEEASKALELSLGDQTSANQIQHMKDHSIIGNRTLSIPPNLDIRSARISQLDEDFQFTYGLIKLLPLSVFRLLKTQPNLREIREGERVMKLYQSYFSQPVYLSMLTEMSNLTTLELQSPHFLSFTFGDLPRTLTRLSSGNPRGTLFAANTREHFEDWRAVYRPDIKVPPTPKSSFGFASAPNEPQETARLAKISRVEDLPRGLVLLSIACCRIPAACDGDWPRGITKLAFTSIDWTDSQLAKLPTRFDQHVDISINGSVLGYGTQPLAPKAPDMDLDASPTAGKPTEEEDGVPTSNLDSGVSARSPIEPFTVSDSLNLSKIGECLLEPFTANSIKVTSFEIPSIFSFASPSLHTLVANTVDHHEFKMLRKGSAPHNLSPFEDAYPCQHDSRNTRSLFGGPSRSIKTPVACYDDFDISILSAYHSLTTLSINLIALTWNQILALPETLKHVSLCVAGKTGQVDVDPFIRLPRFLETLRLDCGSPVILTADGMSHLPPNLTTLECNYLTFNPSLIPEFPRQITSVMIEPKGSWTDVDVWALKQHLGDDLKLLEAGNCALSGALVPLELATSTVTMHLIVEATLRRLGEKVKLSWISLASPFRLFALDLAPPELLSGSQAILPSLGTRAPDSVLTLDIHLAAIPSLLDILPSLPSKLTSLSVRLSKDLAPSQVKFLPSTLKHLYCQFIDGLRVSVGHNLFMVDQLCSALPRQLETFSIELVVNEASSQERVEPLIPSVVEAPLVGRYGIQPLSFALPQVLTRLPGLPTEKLHTLALHPYYLTNGCFADFGPALRTLYCADIQYIMGEAPPTSLTIIPHAPGFLRSGTRPAYLTPSAHPTRVSTRFDVGPFGRPPQPAQLTPTFPARTYNFQR